AAGLSLALQVASRRIGASQPRFPPPKPSVLFECLRDATLPEASRRSYAGFSPGPPGRHDQKSTKRCSCHQTTTPPPSSRHSTSIPDVPPLRSTLAAPLAIGSRMRGTLRNLSACTIQHLRRPRLSSAFAGAKTLKSTRPVSIELTPLTRSHMDFQIGKV